MSTTPIRLVSECGSEAGRGSDTEVPAYPSRNAIRMPVIVAASSRAFCRLRCYNTFSRSDRGALSCKLSRRRKAADMATTPAKDNCPVARQHQFLTRLQHGSACNTRHPSRYARQAVQVGCAWPAPAGRWQAAKTLAAIGLMVVGHQGTQ
jgi:hypothetical protein